MKTMLMVLFTLTLYLMFDINHVNAAMSSSSSSSTKLKGTLHSQYSLDNFLLLAAQSGDIKRVLNYIKLGANPDHDTPRRKMAAIQMLAASGVINKNNIQKLITNGLDIKRKDKLERNILYVLIAGNTSEYLETFLTLFWNYGINIATRDKRKNTLFHVAATHTSKLWTTTLLGVFRTRYTPIARMTFITLPNQNNQTAYDIAIKNGNNEVAKLLQEEFILLKKEVERQNKKITAEQEIMKKQQESIEDFKEFIFDSIQYFLGSKTLGSKTTANNDEDDDNIVPDPQHLKELYQSAWEKPSSSSSTTTSSSSTSQPTKAEKKNYRKSWKK